MSAVDVDNTCFCACCISFFLGENGRVVVCVCFFCFFAIVVVKGLGLLAQRV